MAAPAQPSRSRRSSRPSGDDREAAILHTAERLLEERQMPAISVDDLARGAGISRPTFYFYFSSKNAVFLTLLERVVGEADAALDGLAEKLPADPAKGWRIGISAFYEAFSAHRAVARSGRSALVLDDEVRELWSALMQKCVENTAALIKSERKRGAAPDTIPAEDLATFLNLMNERAMQAAFNDERPSVPDERVVDTLTHIWLTSIYGTAP
ncbi:MAG TPA: TetR/AcrR family transcriptional regulator [Mycobacterium sp.]